MIALELIVGGLMLTGVLTVVSMWARNSTAPVEHRRVQFGPELAEAELIALLDVISALPSSAAVSFETISHDGEIEFWLSASPSTISAVEAALSGIAPHVLTTPVKPEIRTDEPRSWRLGWTGRNGVLLRTDRGDATAAALLGALGSCGEHERVRINSQLRPSARRFASAPPSFDSQDATAFVRKGKLPGLQLCTEISVWTRYDSRAQILLLRLLAPLRSRTGSRGQLRVQSLNNRALRALAFLAGGSNATLTAIETAPLLGWPIGAPTVQGVAYDAAPRISPSRQIPSRTTPDSRRVFGVSNSPGLENRLIVQPTAGATCHSLIVGPSGSGKSWLTANLIAGEIEAGHSVVLVDMKGDTAEDVLARITPRRRRDVVVLEPAHGGPLPGLRTFGGSPELAADLWLSVFRGLFPENFGVRSQRYLRMGLTTLARTQEGATIAELPRLFQDNRYRQSLVSRLDDPLLIGEWEAFEQLSVAQQSEHLLPALGKVSEVISRKSVRAVLAQSEPRITVTEAIRTGKIVVVSLPPGIIGQPAAQLLGALVIFEVWQAVMAQQSLSQSRRRHVGVYIDEPAVLGSLPIPLDTLLETARGMNCGITLAAQSLRQLPDRVMRAALTNAATIATFRPSRADAKLLADELPGMSADQLQRLDPFTLALRLGLSNGLVAPVTTVKTLKLRAATSNADEVRRNSAAQFGVEPEEVDRALRERLHLESVDSIGLSPLGETGDAS